MKHGGWPLDLRWLEEPGQLKIIHPDGKIVEPDHYLRDFRELPMEERHYYQLKKDEKAFKKTHGYIWII